MRYSVGRVAGLALMLAVSGVIGTVDAQKAPGHDPERIAAAKELFVAMGAEQQFDTVIKTMLGGLAAQFKQRQPGAAKDIDDVMGRMAEKFIARKSEVTDMTAPHYAEAFTVAEIKQITAFYKSEIGKKLVQEQPAIMQKSMVQGMQWGQRIGREVELEARQELKKRGVDL
ncbi:MAG: DUF2059 domain-containing protein [Hyphomicrobiaceae bacterium]|nr:DUF2059 domain-containing protein [Hyphomicrobiaceae bacterium]